MNELSIFSYEGREVRTVIQNGAIMWVAKDVADMLGYVWKGNSTIAHVPAEFRGVYSVGTPSGDQPMVCLSEPGLFFFLSRSDKPRALPFQKWVAAEVLPSIRQTGSYSVVKRDPITEVDRVAAVLNQLMPVLGGKLQEITATVETHAERLSAVEEHQAITDPREIEARMFTLHRLKKHLVEGTKDQPDAVTYSGFWSALKERLKVGSFQNRAALTVPQLDEGIKYAQSWCFAKGCEPPSLFEATR